MGKNEGLNTPNNKPTKEKFDIRYELLKNTLDKENIKYDPELKTYEELREYLRNTMSIQEQIALDRKLRTSQDEMLAFADELKMDTNTTSQKVLERMEKAFSKVKDKAAFATLAAITGYGVAELWKLMNMSVSASTAALLTTGGLTAVTGASAVYFGGKALINHRRKVKGELYDQIIKKLEVTRDKDGNIKDTRFDDDEKAEIKKYFETIGKDLDISNYDKIRENIKALKNPQKLELIKRLNEVKGLPLDINKELAKNKQKKIQNIKDTFAAIVKGAVAGTIAILPITQIINKFIPIDILDGVASLGLNAVFGVGGAVVGLVKSIGKTVIENKEEKKQQDIEKRREEAMDRKLYANKGENEDLSERQLLMLEIVKRYVEEKGIAIGDNIENIDELKQIIGTLPKEDKKELNKLLGLMKKQLEKADFEGKANKVLDHTNYSTRVATMNSTIQTIFGENVRNKLGDRCME